MSMAGNTAAGDLPTGRALVEQHAEEAFQRLDKESRRSSTPASPQPSVSNAVPMTESPDRPAVPVENDVLIGHGQGDLSKGKLVCQRVSELAARADLAKQIRVLVKEHATDRVRERTGREPEQDIEVIREELVQEYLQGVKIVDRRLDEEHKTCTATAVMPAHPSLATPRADQDPPALTTR
ncbi:MAG TPA: hypothetical protein VHF07_07535 [Nitrospiraceae bacterium]|nr:hypothetical protein [Nitrospiraceae bacterium]